MLNRKSIGYLFLVIILIVPSVAFAQKQEIKEYKVMAGDSLWDIAARELQDPFLWPKIWKENPDIKNPDKIHPGQIIRIPMYLIAQKEEKAPEPVAAPAEEPRVEAPQKEEPKPVVKITPPLVHRNIFTSSGSIGDGTGFAGTVADAPSGRTLFGNNDIVYIKTDEGAKVGDRYYIYRKAMEVRHPKTRVKMGHVIELIGVLEIKKFEYGETVAEILQAFSEINAGDLLNPYYEMKPPVVSQPFRRPEVDGYVVASRQLKVMNGLFDIVYIDRGKNDGLQPGDLLRVVAAGKHKVPIGLVQVISAQDNTAAVLVVDSKDPIVAGNILTKAEE